MSNYYCFTHYSSLTQIMTIRKNGYFTLAAALIRADRVNSSLRRPDEHGKIMGAWGVNQPCTGISQGYIKCITNFVNWIFSSF